MVRHCQQKRQSTKFSITSARRFLLHHFQLTEVSFYLYRQWQRRLAASPIILMATLLDSSWITRSALYFVKDDREVPALRNEFASPGNFLSWVNQIYSNNYSLLVYCRLFVQKCLILQSKSQNLQPFTPFLLDFSYSCYHEEQFGNLESTNHHGTEVINWWPTT